MTPEQLLKVYRGLVANGDLRPSADTVVDSLTADELAELCRGVDHVYVALSVASEAALQAAQEPAVRAFAEGKIELLHPDYYWNDFGDTHSLMLIADSLAVQNVLAQLLPTGMRDAPATMATLDQILRLGSYLKQQRDSGQGKAEGDVLENVVNALSDLLLGPQTPRLNGNPAGNTWWDTANQTAGTVTYSGRDALYARLKSITGSPIRGANTGTICPRRSARC